MGFKYFVYHTPSGSGRGLHLPLLAPGWGLHFPYVAGGQAITNGLVLHHSNPVRPPEPSPGGHHPEAIPILLVINIPPSPRLSDFQIFCPLVISVLLLDGVIGQFKGLSNGATGYFFQRSNTREYALLKVTGIMLQKKAKTTKPVLNSAKIARKIRSPLPNRRTPPPA